ncbi:juvenile hormone acid methyl transferase [Culex quinquefasciatus]|uniref:Juvenile hormone acid methyl transferase n=1 Tax=Culex quinquefasciatus TaxID=7176 RepID=B0WTB6_CULQU|nr:juvenile hormone acid methyl transferase [Culex quinquefasciatus]|eukprot:XP_001853734.1 juvenile hormone acid methyl transferase [Culex quinquefasciatus]
MNKPNLYHRANGLQRRDAEEILDEFGHLLKWREDGKDSLLDVGSGCGDVLVDFVIPLIPQNFVIILGTDISEQMVRFARKIYSGRKNVSFDRLDIGGDVQHIAFANIFNLLRAEGDCLLTFLARNPIFDIYYQLSKTDKWKKYMSDVDRFISPYQYCENPSEEIGKILSSVGFNKYKIQIMDRIYEYKGIDSLKPVLAVNPFCERMPLDLQEDFMDDYIDIVRKMAYHKNGHEDANDYKFITPYKLVIVYASK